MADIIGLDDFFDPKKGKAAFEALINALNEVQKEFKNTEDSAKEAAKAIDTSLVNAIKGGNNSTDEAVKALDKLTKAAQKQADQLEALKKENAKLKKTKEEVNEVQKESIRLNKERERINAKLSKSNKASALENAKLKLEQQKLNKELKESARESLDLVDAYEKLGKEAAKAKRQAKSLAVQFGINSREAKEAAKASNKLNDELKDIDKSLGDNQRNVGNYSSALSELKEGFGSLLSALSPAALAVAGIAVAAEGLRSGAEAIIEINKQLKTTETLSKLSGTQLKDFTADIRATSKAFDLEFNDTLKAANALTKEFGISGSEAVDLINTGLVRGANINDDFLDQVREYSTQFRAAGVEASTLVEVITLGAQEGVFNDKAVDVVKEGGLRLREFTKATEDALKPLGDLRNEQIQQAVSAGDSFKAIQLVSDGLNDVSLSARQTQTIITDVFGGPGEDAGLRFIKLLGDVNTEQSKVLEGLTERQKRQLSLLEVQEKVAQAEIEIAENFKDTGSQLELLSAKIKLVFLKALDDLIDAFKPVVEAVKSYFKAMGELGAVIDSFRDKTSETKNELSLFQKIIRVITRLWEFQIKVTTKIIEVTTKFIKENKVARAVVNFLVDAITSYVNALLTIPNALAGVILAVKEFFVSFKDVAIGQLKAVGNLIAGIFTFDPDQIQKGLADAKKHASNFGQKIKDAFNEGWNMFSLTDTVKEEIESEEITKEAEKAGEKTAKAFNKGVKKELKKIELKKPKTFDNTDEALKKVEERLNKETKLIQEAEAKRLKAVQDAEDAKEKARLARLNSPITNAAIQVIQDRIKSEILSAAIAAYTGALQQGKTVSEALSIGAQASAGAAIIRAAGGAAAQGFHDGGYTGDGNEYGVAGPAHFKEHVITAAQTDEYGIRHMSASDLDTFIANDGFAQFAKRNNDPIQYNPTITKAAEFDYVKMGEEVTKRMPKHDFSVLAGGHVQESKTQGSKTINTIFKNNNRLL